MNIGGIILAYIISKTKRRVAMSNKIRQSILCLMILALAAPAFAGECHWYTMKGSIIEASDNEIQSCIGTINGAAVGQELNVYRIIKDSPKSPTGLVKEYTGKAKITQVLDGQVARATIIAGKADINSLVELPPFFNSPVPRMVGSVNP
jgi:hypothetical protein